MRDTVKGSEREVERGRGKVRSSKEAGNRVQVTKQVFLVEINYYLSWEDEELSALRSQVQVVAHGRLDLPERFWQLLIKLLAFSLEMSGILGYPNN